MEQSEFAQLIQHSSLSDKDLTLFLAEGEENTAVKRPAPSDMLDVRGLMKSASQQPGAPIVFIGLQERGGESGFPRHFATRSRWYYSFSEQRIKSLINPVKSGNSQRARSVSLDRSLIT